MPARVGIQVFFTTERHNADPPVNVTLNMVARTADQNPTAFVDGEIS